MRLWPRAPGFSLTGCSHRHCYCCLRGSSLSGLVSSATVCSSSFQDGGKCSSCLAMRSAGWMWDFSPYSPRVLLSPISCPFILLDSSAFQTCLCSAQAIIYRSCFSLGRNSGSRFCFRSTLVMVYPPAFYFSKFHRYFLPANILASSMFLL